MGILGATKYAQAIQTWPKGQEVCKDFFGQKAWG